MQIAKFKRKAKPSRAFEPEPACFGVVDDGVRGAGEEETSFVVPLDPQPCPALVDYIARHGVDALATLGEAKHPITGEWLLVHTLVVDAIVRFESVSSVSRGKAREKWVTACEVFEGAAGWRI